MGISRQDNLCILSYCLGHYIVDHIDNREILQRYESSVWYIDLNGIENKTSSNTHTLIVLQKDVILIINTQM